MPVTMRDFVAVVFLPGTGAVLGAPYGAAILAERWGSWGAIPGFIGGGIVGFGGGLIAGFGLMFLLDLANWPFEAWQRKHRPYPPPCRNGKCGTDDYKVVRTPAGFYPRFHISPVGWRCGCGDLYVGTQDCRFLQINEAEGKLIPYLRYRMFKPWEPDTAPPPPPESLAAD